MARVGCWLLGSQGNADHGNHGKGRQTLQPLFAQVGALGAAKDALREVVQLPLQHPGLFAHGSLARPTKGVLLFGPPGERLLFAMMPLPFTRASAPWVSESAACS